jgi:hypothetical protein
VPSTSSDATATGGASYGTSGGTLSAAADGNLADGRPTVASSALLGSPAAHAVDGSLDTAWRTRGSDEWWAVDLGRTTSLAAVVLNWDGGELPSGFSLLTSPDGARWKRVGKAHGQPNGGPTVLGATVKARFVRVNVDGPAKATVALRDVRAFAPAPAPDKRASRDRRDGGQDAGAGAGAGIGTNTGGGTPPLSELPDGSATPAVPADPLPDSQATGFGLATDPVTTAAVLVIVIAGVTSLVVGAQTTKGKHRRKRRRLPVPSASPAQSKPKPKAPPATPPSLPRSKPAPLTPPGLPRAGPPLTPPGLPKVGPPLTPPGLPKVGPPPLTPPSLPRAAPETPPNLPKAPPVTPSRPLKAVPARRPPHTPRPPIEIRWPDWAKLEWVRPNRAKPGRPTKGDAERREHTRVGG